MIRLTTLRDVLWRNLAPRSQLAKVLRVAAYGALIVACVLFTASAWLSMSWNSSNSLPGRLFLIVRGADFARGHLVAYRWHGGAGFPVGEQFVKRVVGMPGDRIVRYGRAFWVADVFVGIAKTASRSGEPLRAADAGLVPTQRYFVAAPHLDSLDSRYAISGTIAHDAIVGRVHVLF